MTCAPLSASKNLKVLIWEGIAKLCPPQLVPPTFDDTKFCLALGEPGTNGHYRLVDLQTAKGVHMRLRDVLPSQPDFTHEPLVTHLPWFEPSFLPLATSPYLKTHRDHHTAREIADFMKSRFRTYTSRGKKVRELRWVTTCLTTDPTVDSAPKYADWEACVFVFIAIDILNHLDGIRHSGFEGQNSSVARDLLVLVACALQYICTSPPNGPTYRPRHTHRRR